jgi:hypothetical protein
MVTEVELNQQIEHHRKWWWFYNHQIKLATRDLSELKKTAERHHEQMKEAEQSLSFVKMPMPSGTDWFRTVPIGKLSLIMDEYGCVRCPTCRGSGVKRERSWFSKEILCPRCRGRTMVQSGTITEEELKDLPLTTQIRVYATPKYSYYHGWSRYNNSEFQVNGDA